MELRPGTLCRCVRTGSTRSVQNTVELLKAQKSKRWGRRFATTVEDAPLQNTLPFAKSFRVLCLVDHVTALSSKGVLFLDLNMKKTKTKTPNHSLKKVKEAAKATYLGTGASRRADCRVHTLLP